MASLLGLVAILLIVVGGVRDWFYHRPIPNPVSDQLLFQGVTYTRDIRSEPRPLVIHVVRVDLTAPGIAFLVTPHDPVDGHHLSARKTSQFLGTYDLQVAINGSFFEPWWSHAVWDYYPHVGDPVNVKGVTGSRGDLYATDPASYPVLYITEDNRVRINDPPAVIYNALAGNAVLLDAGVMPEVPASSFYTETHPRTAVGVDQRGDTLIIMVVDGRQPNYSEGVTLAELAALLREYGAYDAINMDGGGSSTLVIESDSGAPEVLNSTIDNSIPGRERAVGSHLGLWARRLTE